jgi:hypothetical protein
MAIIKFSDIVGDASGRLAGFTIARNQHATYVRPWHPPTNPRTYLSFYRRRNFSRLTQAWSALSQLQRAAYHTFAADPPNYIVNRLGDSVPLSGWQWFVRQNFALLTASRGLASAPPTSYLPTAPTISAFTLIQAPPGTWTCTLTFPEGEHLTWDFMLYCVYSLGPGVTTKFRGHKFITYLRPAAGTSWSPSAAIVAQLGTPIIGHRLHGLIHRQATDGHAGASTVIYADAV